MAPLTTNTMHPCIRRRPRIARMPDLLTGLARIEADIGRGSCNSVMLIGMIKSPALPGVRGVDLSPVVLIVALLEMLADQNPHVALQDLTNVPCLSVRQAYHLKKLSYIFYSDHASR